MDWVLGLGLRYKCSLVVAARSFLAFRRLLKKAWRRLGHPLLLRRSLLQEELAGWFGVRVESESVGRGFAQSPAKLTAGGRRPRWANLAHTSAQRTCSRRWL